MAAGPVVCEATLQVGAASGIPAGVPFGPSRPEERLAQIDFIRGCALFGVLAMNVQYFFRGPYERFAEGRHPWPGFWNAIVDDGLTLLVEGKSMTLFSMLFAVGLAIQLERKEKGGGSFWGFAWRRMGTLFGIGAAHMLLVWNGDILWAYALVGTLLFLFLRRRARTIHIWLGAIFWLLTVGVIVFAQLRASAVPSDPERARELARAAAWAATSLAGYGQTSWWDVAVFRFRDIVEHAGELVIVLLVSFVNFLLGLAVWRTGALKDPASHLPRIRRAALWLAGLGLATGIVALYTRPIMVFARSHGAWAKVFAVPVALSQVYHLPLLGLGFGAILLIAWQSGRWRRALEPLTKAGRMALTNYLAQSLAMTALFCGWGLGFYGRVGPLAGLGISVLFFAIQVALSRWWLSRFEFGPMEWLWRCAGYARRQPFLKCKG